MRFKFLPILWLLFFLLFCRKDGKEISIVLRLRNRYTTKAYGFVGQVCENNSCRVLCFLDLNDSILSPVDFSNGRACILKEFEGEVAKYLPSPSIGETIFFLENNQKVGAGIIDSIKSFGLGGRIYYSVIEGRIGNLSVSKKLFISFDKEIIVRCKELKDEKILTAIVNKLKEKRVGVHCLDNFKIIKKIPCLLSGKEIKWLVTLEAKIKILKNYQDLISEYYKENQTTDHSLEEELFKEKCQNLRYIINAILTNDPKPTVEFIVANSTLTELDPKILHKYCFDNLLYFLRPDGEKVVGMHEKENDYFIMLSWMNEEGHPTDIYIHYDSFIDWVDIDGDGNGEVILSWWGYEGEGLMLLKKKNNKWVVIAELYEGV